MKKYENLYIEIVVIEDVILNASNLSTDWVDGSDWL